MPFGNGAHSASTKYERALLVAVAIIYWLLQTGHEHTVWISFSAFFQFACRVYYSMGSTHSNILLQELAGGLIDTDGSVCGL